MNCSLEQNISCASQSLIMYVKQEIDLFCLSLKYCDTLEDFIKIYNERNKTLGTCLTKMALANMPNSKGQMPKGTSVGKGKKINK